MTHRHAISAALLLGLLAAPSVSAAGSTPAAPTMPAAPPQLPSLLAPPVAAMPVAPVVDCRNDTSPPGRGAPAAVKQALGILRRPRQDADALPAQALRALRRAGLDVPDPTVARRLRQAGRGTAWIVPVGDLRPLLTPIRCASAPPALPRPSQRGRTPRPLPARPPRTRTAPRVPAPLPAVPVFAAPPRAPARVLRGPQSGVAVVAMGDVLGGGGGTLHDLLRGQTAPVVTPCAGPRDDLVGVSGVVPDGVDAVYLTTTDGSAVRADVADNGYAFHVPPAARAAMRVTRYVVWTGRDGVPHVSPVMLPRLPERACTAYQRDIAARVSLDPRGFAFPVVVRTALPAVPRHP